MSKKILFLSAALIIGASFFAGIQFSLAEDAISPGEVACAMDAKQCADGSYVSRVAPACEFAACPVNSAQCGKLIYFCSDNSPYCDLTNPVIDQYMQNSGCVEVTKHIIADFLELNKDSLAVQYNILAVPAFLFIDKNGCFGGIGKGGGTKIEDIKSGIANFKCQNQPSITILSPNGGEAWTKGTTQTIKWQDNRPVAVCATSSVGAPSMSCINPAPRIYDIFLNGATTCSGNNCTMGFPVHTIAKGVSGSSHNWSVGKNLDTYPEVVPDGSYTIQICQSGTNTCDSSDSYFSITSGNSTNGSPKITSFPPIPANVQPGQTVKISLSATDPDNDDLSWSVDWDLGDNISVVGPSCSITRRQTGTGWNYSTSYAWAKAGTYQVKVTVSDCVGGNDSYSFPITIGNSTNRPPVINGATAPTTLSLNQTGAWTVRASDPENGPLSYSVDWGDVSSSPMSGSAAASLPFVQTSTFTHSYSSAGTYTVAFTVKDNGGLTAQTSSTVQVGNTAQPSITVVSPNGGETYKNDGSPITVKWQTNNVPASHVIDIIRLRVYPSGREYNLATNVLNDGQEAVVPSSVPVGAYTLEIKTYLGETLVMDSSDSYFKMVDVFQNQPPIIAPSATVREQVKCVFQFKGAVAEQKCHTAADDPSPYSGYGCSGTESCVIDLKGINGDKITWKSSCGGYAYTIMDGSSDYAIFDCAASTVETSPTSKIVKEKIEQISDINEKSKLLSYNNFDFILAELNQLRSIIKEQQTEIKYLTSLVKDVKNLSEKSQDAITNFITYGVDANTEKLGAGERAAVMNSYKAAFDKLPETEAELADAIKIANGRFPSVTSHEAEKTAKEQFVKIYKRLADLNNAKDNAAIKVMAYGLRQKAENRNLNSEKAGIKIFKNIFGKVPTTTEDWNTMQAITYSGATR